MTVRASVRLDVRFRVDGAAWEALDPVFRTASARVPGGRVARRARRPALSRPAGGARRAAG